jgi:hypothetical protein
MMLQEADAAAAAIMTTTEGAVRTEMEAKGIFEQVRIAVEAAQRGKLDQLASAQETVDIDWEKSAHDEKPQTGAVEEKEMHDHHRVRQNPSQFLCDISQILLLWMCCLVKPSLQKTSQQSGVERVSQPFVARVTDCE